VTLILLFILPGWPSIARIVRAGFLLLRRQGFTEAAQAQGISARRIVIRHLLPNALPNIINAFTATIALFWVTEATLDFLSLGISAQMTWGRAFATFYEDVLTQSWWSLVFPGVAIVLTVVAVNLVGEALRDALTVRD
jgi:peptide/nickel transport system permease protein